MKTLGDAIKFVLKAYFGGCFGCLGVLSVAIALIMVFVLVLGPQLAGVAQQIPNILAPLVSGTGGPPGGPGMMITPAPAPTPTGVLPQIEIWFTQENRPDAERITTMKLGGAQGQQEWRAYVWAKGPKGASASFDLWMVSPDGKRERFGPPNQQFRTDPTGNPVMTGMGGPPPNKGTYAFEAVIGTTTVGSTTIIVQ